MAAATGAWSVGYRVVSSGQPSLVLHRLHLLGPELRI